MVLQFCSIMACRLPTWESRCLMYAIPVDLIVGSTLDPLHDALAWSFSILATGVMPSTSHLGIPFPPHSRRAALSGQRVCGPYSLIFCQTLGDLKWVKEEFKLKQHYGTNDCCWRCTASATGCASAPTCGPAARRRWSRAARRRCCSRRGGGAKRRRVACRPPPSTARTWRWRCFAAATSSLR